MSSAYLNASRKEDTITAGFLFTETEPPRKCPFYSPFCNLLAPNDNAYVQTFSVDGVLYSATDSTTLVTVDPVSLNVTGNLLVGKEEMYKGMVNFLASAHPVLHPGCEW